VSSPTLQNRLATRIKATGVMVGRDRKFLSHHIFWSSLLLTDSHHGHQTIILANTVTNCVVVLSKYQIRFQMAVVWLETTKIQERNCLVIL